MKRNSRSDYERALQMYRNYPMPIRSEEDDRQGRYRRPGDDPHAIRQFAFDGRDAFSGPCRILIAGGGTGDSTLFFAKHLKEIGSQGHIIHLDQSPAANDHCRERLARFGLDNVEIHECSLYELSPERHGLFDYVNCNGVLHHLEDPDLGLRKLAAVTRDDGGLGIWIYAKYGRAGQYHIRSMVHQLLGDRPADAHGVQISQDIYKGLPASSLGRFSGGGSLEALENENSTPDRLGEQFADRFLNQSDIPYSTSEMFDFIKRNGLTFASFQLAREALLYDPRNFVKSPSILQMLETLSIEQRGEFAEMWHCRLNMHRCYLRKAPVSGILSDDRRLRWISKFAPSMMGRGRHLKIETPIGPLTLSLSEVMVRLFEGFDGTRSVGELVNQDPSLKSAISGSDEALLRVLMLARCLEFVDF